MCSFVTAAPGHSRPDHLTTEGPSPRVGWRVRCRACGDAAEAGEPGWGPSSAFDAPRDPPCSPAGRRPLLPGGPAPFTSPSLPARPGLGRPSRAQVPPTRTTGHWGVARARSWAPAGVFMNKAQPASEQRRGRRPHDQTERCRPRVGIQKTLFVAESTRQNRKWKHPPFTETVKCEMHEASGTICRLQMKENGASGRESGRGCDGTNERCTSRSTEWPLPARPPGRRRCRRQSV